MECFVGALSCILYFGQKLEGQTFYYILYYIGKYPKQIKQLLLLPCVTNFTRTSNNNYSVNFGFGIGSSLIFLEVLQTWISKTSFLTFFCAARPQPTDYAVTSFSSKTTFFKWQFYTLPIMLQKWDLCQIKDFFLYFQNIQKNIFIKLNFENSWHKLKICCLEE